MDQAGSDADIYLEPDSTRFSKRLEQTTDSEPDESRITIDPNGASVTLRDGEEEPGGKLRVVSQNQSADATLDSRQGRGRLGVGSSGNDRVILRSDGFAGTLRSYHEGTVGVELWGKDQRGHLKVFNSDSNTVVEARSKRVTREVSPGVLEVNTRFGESTVRLSGLDARLELDSRDGSEDDDRNLGGGDLLVRDYSSEDRPDTYVHATADTDTNYGVDNENRPRIFVDGPNATLELGRGNLPGPSRKAVGGGIKLRTDIDQIENDERTNTLLEVEATAPNNTNENREGVVSLRHDGGKKPSDSGTMNSESRGVAFGDVSVPGGAPAMLVEHQPSASIEETVRTKKKVDEGSISKAGPSFGKSIFKVPRGELIDLLLTFGDGASFFLQIGDEEENNYQLDATLEPRTDPEVTLTFDTGVAGDARDDTRTLTVDGDADLAIENETRIDDPPLASALYELLISGTYGEDVASLEVRRE
jgi:hypothetical protein